VTYALHLLIYFNIYALLALSLNLVVGYCGIITLAHAAYFAIGGYAYALSTSALGLGFIPSAFIALAVGAALSVAVSVPAWRFRGDFILLITLAVQVLFFGILHNWSSVTNGPLGIAGVSKPVIGSIEFDTIGSMAILSTVLAGAAGWTLWSLQTSPWGRLLKAMRDDELATRSLGKDVRVAKLFVLAFACGFAGLAGAIQASYATFIDPSMGSLDQSVLLLSMLIVGGTANMRGPLTGVAILLAIPEILRLCQLPDAIAGNLRMLAYGLLLTIVVHIRPRGVAGEYSVG
jgi:branched-chain amino acid transport system permease protein